MFCPYCGTKAQAGARFCRECGTMLPMSSLAADGETEYDAGAERADSAADSAEKPQENVPETPDAEYSAPGEAFSFDESDTSILDQAVYDENQTAVPDAGDASLSGSGDARGSEHDSADAVSEEGNSEEKAAAASGGRRRILIPAVVIAAVVLIILVNVIVGLIPTRQERWQEQYDLGQQYLLDLDYEQAVLAFTEAIEIDENRADAYISRAEAYLGSDAQTASSEDQELALADYTTALSIDDTLTEVYVSRGDLYAAISPDEGNLNAAISDYTSALTLDDTLTEIYVKRGDLHVQLGSDEENLNAALSDYTSALALDDTLTEVYVSRGDLRVQLGPEEENLLAAVSDYDAALALDESRVTLYLTEAGIYVVLADYRSAVTAYTNAIERQLDTAEVYLGRAESYFALGTEGSGAGDELSERALSEEEQEYLTAAAEDYRTVIDLGDVSEENYTQSARIYILLGDYDSAAAILDEGDDLYPGSETIIDLTEQAAALIVEREYQAYLAELRSMIEESWWDDVTRFVELLQSDADGIAEADWLNADLYSYLVNDLEEILIWEYDSGQYLVFYPGGPVYYGEMEDEERSGEGILIWADLDPSGGNYEMHVYEGPWSGNLPNGTGRYCLVWNSSSQTSHTCFTINFVDGLGEGTGSAVAVVNGKSTSEESYAVEASAGELTLSYTAPTGKEVALLVDISGTTWWYNGTKLSVDEAFVGVGEDAAEGDAAE